MHERCCQGYFKINNIKSPKKSPRCAIYFEKPNGQVAEFIGAILDITERKKIENEKEKLIIELQEALDKVKLLSGFLPTLRYIRIRMLTES